MPSKYMTNNEHHWSEGKCKMKLNKMLSYGQKVSNLKY